MKDTSKTAEDAVQEFLNGWEDRKGSVLACGEKMKDTSKTAEG